MITENSKDNLKYLLPYEKRNLFSLKDRPLNLPFEIFAYFRHFQLKEFPDRGDKFIESSLLVKLMRFETEFVYQYGRVMN